MINNTSLLFIQLGKELGNLENYRDEILSKLKSKEFLTLGEMMSAESNLVSQLNKVKYLMNELEIGTDKIGFEEYDKLLDELSQKIKYRSTIY